jgi:hypothetical protein
MHEINYINSILTAVDEINSRQKKRGMANVSSSQNFIPKLNKNLAIPTDVNNIISEAEEYKKKPLFDHAVSDLVKNKNTLKVISNLNLKIEDLEKKLKNFQFKKLKTTNIDKVALNSEAVHSTNTLELTIINLNKKIENFKKIEDELRSQIIKISQDILLITGKNKKLEDLYNSVKTTKDEKDTKIILRSIYNKVEKHRKIFINLNNNLFKTKRDLIFYKENYERLIIENDKIINKLINTNN